MNKIFLLMVFGWVSVLALVAVAEVHQASDDLQTFSEPCEKVDYPASSTPMPTLSVALCEMIEQGNVERLAEILQNSRRLLIEQARAFDLRVRFFIGQAQREEVERFNKLLERGNGSLELLEESVGRLTEFMEWVPVAQWDQRFGRNGFYRQVVRLSSHVEFLRAVHHYYIASVGMSKQRDAKEVVKELYEATGFLDQCIDDAESGDDVELRLWQLKVKLLLTQYEPELLSEIRPMMESLLKEKLNGNQLWSMRLAALSQSHLMAREDAEQVRQQIQKTGEWLKAHQESAKQVAPKKLELRIFEGGLEKYWFQLQGKKDFGAFLDRQIVPLEQLAQDEPGLCRTIELLVAQQIEPFFSQRDSRKWSAFELISLRRYYQAKESASLDRALEVCELFLTTISPDHPAYPKMLYEKGLGHYQKMQVKGEATQEKIKACQAWQRLAKTYPTWSLKVGVSAESAAMLAANMTYNLFVEDPNQYGELALSVLATLVGDFKQGQGEPVGPLSQSRAAKSYRYYYGQVLMAQQQYQLAAQVFRSVTKEDSHYGQACYQSAKCTIQLYPKETHREQLVQELTSLVQTIDQEGDDPDVLEVVLTLAGLHMNSAEADDKSVIDLLDYFSAYWKGLEKQDSAYSTVIFVRVLSLRELGRIPQALEELRPALQANSADSKLWHASMSLMQGYQELLFTQHVQGQHDSLIPLLEAVLPVSALLHSQIKNGVGAEWVDLANRLYLEQLALWLLGPNNEEAQTTLRLEKANELVEALGAQEKIASRLWFMRCRALLAFSQGEFKSSQVLWYRIRQNSSPQGDTSHTWWEARYFGLVCLSEQEGATAVEGLIEQVLRRYPAEKSPWIQRLKQFKDGLKVKK